MNRWFLAVLLMAVSAHFSMMQPKQDPASSPTVSISLPADIPSETVQIRYLMAGSFGGYGGFIEPRPNQTSYEIDASTQGKPANSIKILVYAAGCKIQTFDLDLTRVSYPKGRFVCELLPQIRIDGEIPSDLMRHENAELNVSYMAFWASRFLGIADGPVTEFQVVKTMPDPDGSFRVDIPAFSADNTGSAYPGGASLRFTLRDSKTLNPIALNLSPEQAEYQSETHQLRILSSYPIGLKFVNSLESPDSAGDFRAHALTPPSKNASPAIPR
jgi:hypothetical protein